MKNCPKCLLALPDEDLAYCPYCEHNLTSDVYQRGYSMGTIWGGVAIFCVIAFVIFGLTVYHKSLYNSGYSDGENELKNEFLYSMSKRYQEGYDDGVNLAWYFEQGCEDKVGRRPPKYPDEEKYMEGYNFC